MVRRGSTVRVRQRALRSSCKYAFSLAVVERWRMRTLPETEGVDGRRDSGRVNNACKWWGAVAATARRSSWGPVLATDSVPFARLSKERLRCRHRSSEADMQTAKRAAAHRGSRRFQASQYTVRAPARRQSSCVAGVGSTGEAQDAHTARRGRRRLCALRSGLPPARGRARLRAGRLDRRRIVRTTRGNCVFRRRASIELASLCRGRRHAAPCRLVRGDSLELRATVSYRFASRAVRRGRSPDTQRGHSGEAYVARHRTRDARRGEVRFQIQLGDVTALSLRQFRGCGVDTRRPVELRELDDLLETLCRRAASCAPGHGCRAAVVRLSAARPRSWRLAGRRGRGVCQVVEGELRPVHRECLVNEDRGRRAPIERRCRFVVRVGHRVPPLD
jgi:hypothetical protein